MGEMLREFWREMRGEMGVAVAVAVEEVLVGWWLTAETMLGVAVLGRSSERLSGAV